MNKNRSFITFSQKVNSSSWKLFSYFLYDNIRDNAINIYKNCWMKWKYGVRS